MPLCSSFDAPPRLPDQYSWSRKRDPSILTFALNAPLTLTLTLAAHTYAAKAVNARTPTRDDTYAPYRAVSVFHFLRFFSHCIYIAIADLIAVQIGSGLLQVGSEPGQSNEMLKTNSQIPVGARK